MKRVAGGAFALVMALVMGGCTPKNVTYIQDFNENMVIESARQQTMRVQPGDKLSIIVHSKNPDLASLFNLPVVTSSTNQMGLTSGTGTQQRNYAASTGISAYTVSPQGNIDFPVLGQLHIAGMTRNEVSAFIKGELIGRDHLKDPTVTVEFLNNGISVLGEVRQPGRYDMNRDNINLLEAIALAGDLTIQGKRENVKVIREEGNGQVRIYELDLTQGSKLMESPAYYLKQNDVIYVEPTNIRKRETTVNGNSALSTGFWISAASLLTSIAVLVVNLVK
ncbi:MAG: polysaccharide biosynthesis/export family protein [Muribaculaceae bacterium]|nr:polysaccharide biosynthesis/export family protein [Muribaculaceae bacterium]